MAFQIALAATPVAVYFLILGLLNSQRRPQLLSARLDFALLMAALAPLCVVPVVRWVGATAGTVLGATALVVAAIALGAPKSRSGWVIYNLGRAGGIEAMIAACRRAGLDFRRRADRLELAGGAALELSAFPLLRNVSIRATGPLTKADAARFEDELARSLNRIEATASPTAVAFVLVSTAAIVAPLALMADRMPEMVRLLTDLLG